MKYKTIQLKEETHKKFKQQALNEEKSLLQLCDDLINKRIKYYKRLKNEKY